MSIHPAAIIEDGAELGADVSIGPFCHVGPNVKLGDGVTLGSHVVIAGDTKIGAHSKLFSFAAIGLEPQDLKFKGEAVSLEIGARCLIRENVTIHPGTEGGGFKTVIGNDCAFLAGSHIAHDCHVGDHVILSNNVMIAGHVNIGSNVIFGGGSAVHQFARVGDGAFIGGLAGVEHDLLPFAIAVGNRAEIAGPNLVGLRRAGFEKSEIHLVRDAFNLLFDGEKPMRSAVNDLIAFAADKQSSLLDVLLKFVQQDSARSYVSMRKRG